VSARQGTPWIWPEKQADFDEQPKAPIVLQVVVSLEID
jgi:hypothetical protein